MWHLCREARAGGQPLLAVVPGGMQLSSYVGMTRAGSHSWQLIMERRVTAGLDPTGGFVPVEAHLLKLSFATALALFPIDGVETFR